MTASATVESGVKTVFVPITPCRVMDTRAAPLTVGPRATPIGQGETYSIAVRGTNGNCTIPADAVGLSMNVTVINPTAGSFLTVFPSLATRPLASNLNFVAGQAPVPNAVEAKIGDDGKVAFFNNAGSVDVAADIVGYYVDHNHNDLYYTKAQTDAALALKANKLLFAQVDGATGAVVNGSPGVVGTRINLGRYSVDFGLNVTACVNTATIGNAAGGVSPTGIIDTADRDGNVNAVFVHTATDASADADRPFNLIVVC
jgi:hypothetical protein